MNSSQSSTSSKSDRNLPPSKKPQTSFELTSINPSKQNDTQNTSLASAQRPLLDLSDDQIGQPRNRLKPSKNNSTEPPSSPKSQAEETPREKKLGVFRRLKNYLLSPEHSATFKCFCFFIYIIFGFIVLAFYYYYYNSTAAEILPTFAGSLKYIGQNLNATPIQELRILPSTSRCPNGFEQLTLGYYRGTEKGCCCPDIPLLMQGSCNRKSDCTDYPSVDYQTIKLWKSQKFCVKRTVNLTQAITCDEGFFQCYPGACIPSSLTCPLTKDDIAMVLASGYFDSTITTTTFKGKNTPGSTTLPLFTIETSLYNTPCFDSFALQSNPTYYPLVSQKPSGCGRYSEDLNSFQIDSQTELKLYTQNNFNTALEALPLYSEFLQSGKALLVGRKKLEINVTEECMNMDPIAMLALSEKTYSINSKISTSLKYGAYVHTMALMSCFIAFFFMKSGLKTRKEIFRKDIFQFLYIAFALIEVVIYLLLFLSVTSNTILIVTNSETIETLSELQCFIDIQTVEVLQDYSEMIESIIGTLSGFSSLIFINQAACAGLLILGWVGSKIPTTKEEENSEEGDEKENDDVNETRSDKEQD